jgi:hypothetical protein
MEETSKNNETAQLGIGAVMPSLPYPEFKIVSIIAGACLKHSDSGEGSFNKEARTILMELENAGYEVVKRQ